VKTQGRHGEVAVEVHSDVPDRFHQGMQLLALSEEGARRELKIEELWPHKTYLVLKFAGVDSISEAETIVGAELQVSKENRAQLEAGWNYVSDLVGCTLFDGEREIGIVNDVRFGAGEAPLLVVVVGTQEHEIPFAEAFLQSLDIAGKRIIMNLPEGLLEVNAPLTAEEKEQQRQ
jgi:16S rRNA processing protein RimM